MKPQDFLSKAKNSPEVTFLNEYKSESIVWDYYSNFTGYLNGNIFVFTSRQFPTRKELKFLN
jgi:hypothetical protein